MVSIKKKNYNTLFRVFEVSFVRSFFLVNNCLVGIAKCEFEHSTYLINILYLHSDCHDIPEKSF